MDNMSEARKAVQEMIEYKNQLRKKYGYPEELIDGVTDTFDYVVKLRTGELIRFESVTPESFDWVCLHSEEGFTDLPYRCPRGITVRVQDIVWLAKAPEGS